MSFPIPSTASPSSSDDSTVPPRTPVSPHALPVPVPHSNLISVAPGAVQTKRKPSRRANTAERRATHNAVERQRRETLNGRFLDLAALLPNLSQIRRPSKSSIVNSSIAHVHASRRHSALAARELRNLKLEADTLRCELNEWRDRAGLPRAEEPLRGDGFAMILSGELEVLPSIPDDDDELGLPAYDALDEVDDGFTAGLALQSNNIHDPRNPMPQNIAMLKSASTGPYVRSLAPAAHYGPQQNTHVRPCQQGPMIVSNPQTASYENPAMASLYEPHPHAYEGTHFLPHQAMEAEKVAWDTQFYPAQQQQHHQHPQQLQRQVMRAQRPLFMPSATSGESPKVETAAFVDPTSQALFARFQQQQQQQPAAVPLHTSALYGADCDDTSSVGSGSASGGSGFGSPYHNGSPSSYELVGAPPEYSVPRTASMWGREAEGMTGMGMMKPGLGSPINLGGGGGNGTGFAMMM